MDKLQSRGHLLTEQINPNSQNLDFQIFAFEAKPKRMVKLHDIHL